MSRSKCPIRSSFEMVNDGSSCNTPHLYFLLLFFFILSLLACIIFYSSLFTHTLLVLSSFILLYSITSGLYYILLFFFILSLLTCVIFFYFSLFSHSLHVLSSFILLNIDIFIGNVCFSLCIYIVCEKLYLNFYMPENDKVARKFSQHYLSFNFSSD